MVASEETTQEEQAVALAELEREQRASWNRARFEELGFQNEIADLLVDARTDWHDADRLLKQGCTHDLVLRLLL